MTKHKAKPAHTMKLIVFTTLLTFLCPLFAEDNSNAPADPFAGAFFTSDLVLLARDQIGMTQEQWEAFRAHLEKVAPRSDELRGKLERENAALSALAKQERVDEAALIAQFAKVLAVERDLKYLHVGLLIAIKNLLTPEQQTKLREIAQDSGTQLAEAARRRLSKKVKAGVQKWVESGRDPSAIAQAMKEKVKPLIEAGNIIGAEAEIDRLLEQLKPDTK